MTATTSGPLKWRANKLIWVTPQNKRSLHDNYWSDLLGFLALKAGRWFLGTEILNVFSSLCFPTPPQSIKLTFSCCAENAGCIRLVFSNLKMQLLPQTRHVKFVTVIKENVTSWSMEELLYWLNLGKTNFSKVNCDPRSSRTSFPIKVFNFSNIR